MDLGFTPSINAPDVIGGAIRPSHLTQSLDWNISNPNNLYEEMFRQQSEYNNHIESREDSAVQRWVEDVKKAGLNPWAFTGSGASTSTLTSPRQSAFDSMMSYLNFDINKTDRRTKNILGAVKIGASIFGSIMNALF